MSPIGKKLLACITKIEQTSSQTIDSALLQAFSTLVSQATLKDFCYPGVILAKILYSPVFCRAQLFEIILKARPELDLIFTPLDPHNKKFAFNIIAFKNAQDLWDVIERNNIPISYEMLVDTLAIFCTDNIMHQMFTLFDRQNPRFDYSTEANTWFYKNTISPIFIAADYGHSKVFEFLLEKGCSIFEYDRQEMIDSEPHTRACLDFAVQRKPLHAHIQKNNGTIDDLAIEKKRAYFFILDLIYKTIALQSKPISLDLYYAASANPLHSAIGQKDVSLLLKLLTLIKKYSTYINCTIDTTDNDGQTPLMYALRTYHSHTHESDSKIFNILVAQGAQLHITDKYSVSPFFFLRPEHPVAFAHTMIDKVFSSEDRSEKEQFIAPIVLPPIETRPDPDYITHYGLFQGKTIAHHAAFLAHPCVIQKLLNHGVSFQHQDLVGFSPIFSYVSSPHPVDIELFKLIMNSISQQGHDLFKTTSGFSANTEIDLHMQEEIANRVEYFRDFNIFELSIYFQRIDFVIYLMEQGALLVQSHLNRDSFFQIIIDAMEEQQDRTLFCQKFVIPILNYLKAHPIYIQDLLFDDSITLTHVILRPRIYFSLIEFLDTAFPDVFFKNINTLTYQEAFNAFAAQKDSFPDESSVFWYRSFLQKWIAYRQTHHQDLFSENKFSPSFLTTLWDSKHRPLVDDFIQQASVQIRSKEKGNETAIYALEKSAFVEKLILFFITHNNPRMISVLISIIQSGALSRFFEQPDAINQTFAWINNTYEKISKDNKELIQHDIDLLYFQVIEYALQLHVDFHLNLADLCDQKSCWLERALTNKIIKKTALIALFENQAQKNNYSRGEIALFIQVYKKIHPFQNRKPYMGIGSEIDFFIKKMIFNYCSDQILMSLLDTDQGALEWLKSTLAEFIAMGLSLTEWNSNILYLSILVNTKKIEVVSLSTIEREAFFSTDGLSFIERVKPDLVAEYDSLLQKIKEAVLPQEQEIERSPICTPEQASKLESHDADSPFVMDEHSHLFCESQNWITSAKKDKKTNKKSLLPSETTSFAASKTSSDKIRKQPSILFQKRIEKPEVNKIKTSSEGCSVTHSYNPELGSLTTISHQSDERNSDSTQAVLTESVSFISEKKLEPQKAPSLAKLPCREKSIAFLLSYRDVGHCTKERLNNLIDFTLCDLYNSLKNKQYDEAVDIWEHLKPYSKNQAPLEIVAVITLIKDRAMHRVEQLINSVSFHSLLLKQQYESEYTEHPYVYSQLARQHMKHYHAFSHQASQHLKLAKQAEIKALSLLKRKSPGTH